MLANCQLKYFIKEKNYYFISFLNIYIVSSLAGLKISISPMPKDLKAITKNNLSKVISAMLEGKGAAQLNSIGDLKIKAIIDYQEGMIFT